MQTASMLLVAATGLILAATVWLIVWRSRRS
jgi:hypothetical protein